MSELTDQPSAPLSVEEMAKSSIRQAREGICQRYHECEEQIRKSPTTSVLGAVAVGYLLHRLPVRAILVTKIRILSALAPPALFLFGAAKLYDFLQKQDCGKRP